MMFRRPLARVLLVVCLFGVATVEARSQGNADSLDQALASFFKEHPPELFRYGGLAMYGEEAEPFDQARIAQEIGFVKQVRASQRMQHPTDPVWALCHDVLIHSPAVGREFLSALNTSI